MSQSLVILISGTSSGFGALIAKAAARRGHQVYASMRGLSGKNAAAAAELSGWASTEGVKLTVVEMDVLDDTSVHHAVEEVLSRARRLDVVVNNAGGTAFGLLETFSLEQVRQLFELNVFSAMRVNRAALPAMRAQKSGLLVQITSAGGRYVLPFFGPYTSAKYAAEAMAETYRYELASEGIDSVIVEPGGFATSLAKNAVQASDTERLASYGRGKELLTAVAQGMAAASSTEDPEDVANAITDLIETPYGSRPLRTVVGKLAKSLLDEFNADTDRITEARFKALGMGEMLKSSPKRVK